MLEEQEYYVGDVVKIVSVDDCVFGADDSMRDMVGSVATIVSAKYDKSWRAWDYRLAEDNQYWFWDRSCFELANIPDLGDIEASEMDILSFIKG